MVKMSTWVIACLVLKFLGEKKKSGEWKGEGTKQVLKKY